MNERTDPGPRTQRNDRLQASRPGPRPHPPARLSVSQRPNQNAPDLIQANPSCSLAPSTRGRRETTKWPSRAHQKRNSSLPASLRSASNGTLSAVQSGEVSAISSGPSAGRRRHGGCRQSASIRPVGGGDMANNVAAHSSVLGILHIINSLRIRGQGERWLQGGR